ncbi:MAG TPA: hypothetical protein VL263_17605 [Vicinamibacterales bacterium]|nr:hypothetical protein [Vicinamibacterales bacterium]
MFEVAGTVVNNSADGGVLTSQTETIIATRARIIRHYDEWPIVTQADSGCEPPWATM